MRSAIATVAFAAFAAAAPKPNPVAAAAPAGVSSAIAPSGTAEGCSPSYDGTFQIQVVNVTSSKRDLEKRQGNGGSLQISLQDGVLTDDEGRTGYVAANQQFQFDAPPQAGAIYTSGFSVCQNGTLAIGDDAVWYSCLSGTFYNLYDENELGAGQCFPVYINVIGGGSPSGGEAPEESSAAPSSSAPAATSAPPATSAPASSAPPATSAPAVTQISDGQPQAPTGTGAAPASSYTGPAIATGAAAPTGVPQQMIGLAGAALAAVALF